MLDVQFLSELLIVLLKKDISGFDQDGLDEFYAEFEDPLEDNPEFNEDEIKERFVRARRFLISLEQSLEQNKSIISRYAKDSKNFYTLWAIIVLNFDRLPPLPDFAATYAQFMEEVQRFQGQQDLEEFAQGKKDQSFRYYTNSLGANTEAKAEQVICTEFEFCERRPKSNHHTSKQSDSFRFDDLRLYVKWQDAPGVRTTGLAGLLFEVQIKTFLQHAWSIATHDLIYKSDEKNWPKERIAYQVKAMLEHAEVSIQEAENLAKSSNIPKTDTISSRISETIKFISDLWPEDDLPVDKKRLAENIDNLMRCLKINLQALRQILNRESELERGTKTLNLSPYGVIVQSLINQAHDKVADFLSSDPERRKFRIFFPRK